MSEEDFREAFRYSPVKRAKWRGLLGNIASAVSALNELEADHLP